GRRDGTDDGKNPGGVAFNVAGDIESDERDVHGDREPRGVLIDHWEELVRRRREREEVQRVVVEITRVAGQCKCWGFSAMAWVDKLGEWKRCFGGKSSKRA
ncbi:hypothetical protein U1Q18_027317, partial [Sarracenia purpurea var. burkii]